MATWRPAHIHIGQGTWPDPAAGGKGAPLWRDTDDWPVNLARLARRQALVLTSAAFIAGEPDAAAICQELADRLARGMVVTCLIRPLDDGRRDLPVALAQPREDVHAQLAELIAAEPHALAAACVARAAEMRGSILLRQVSSKCLRLWSKEAAWPVLAQFRIGSMLIAPMRARERVVGSIVVWRKLGSPPLQEEERAFLEEVARRTARVYS